MTLARSAPSVPFGCVARAKVCKRQPVFLKLEILSGGGIISGMKRRLVHNFEEIISVENLCAAWGEFLNGKRGKTDVQIFARNLSDNIIQLHNDLAEGSYRHGGYYAFRIADPKPREIHKASVRDRLVHHAVYRVLYPFFDRTFVADSFSCRNGKGTHRALKKFKAATFKASQNHQRTCWVLQCDIRKFFANINQQKVIEILREYISDEKLINLLAHIIKSFQVASGVGLPLGNLTSQLFTNIYMNKLDQLVKHRLRAEYYIRYADDFIILSSDRQWLLVALAQMQKFLADELGLAIHPDKIYLQTIFSGVDFLGWINFPQHRVMRASTRRRMFRRLVSCPKSSVLASYRGLLQHGNAHRLREQAENIMMLSAEPYFG